MDSQRLRLEVEYELDQLAQLRQAAEELIQTVNRSSNPATWHAAAGAKYVADLWLGLENLCKRRYAFLGSSVPQGPDSHQRILTAFCTPPAPGAAWSLDMQSRWKKYLRFRHRTMHGYGFAVAWDNVAEPLRLLPETITALDQTWRLWLNDPC